MLSPVPTTVIGRCDLGWGWSSKPAAGALSHLRASWWRVSSVRSHGRCALRYLPRTSSVPPLPRSPAAAPGLFGEISAAVATVTGGGPGRSQRCGLCGMGEGLALGPTWCSGPHLVPWALTLCSCSDCHKVSLRQSHELVPLHLFLMGVPNPSEELLGGGPHSLASILPVLSHHAFSPFVPCYLPSPSPTQVMKWQKPVRGEGVCMCIYTVVFKAG